MSKSTYESTLNTWLADALQQQGLDARAESKQGGGKRLDIEVNFDDMKIALEAEQGDSKSKRAEAIKDADGRLDDELADCAIAICYPAGITSRSELAACTLQHTLRAPGDRTPANKTQWERSDIAQLASVIRQVPAQLGDPDKIADKLSFSLDRAVARLSESQKQDLAASLDLPPGRAIKIGENSRYNQAAKRAMLVIATAVMFHARLDSVHKQIPALMDNRQSPPTLYAGEWPPPRANICAESDDPITAFYHAWDLWLVVDYKPIFATARNALQGCAPDNDFSKAVQGTAKAALQVVRNIVGLRHDLLGRIFHKVLETARYDGSFYTTTAAATLLANLAIREDMCDWADPAAIGRLRITDPACGTGTLLMAAAERIRDLSTAARKDQVSQALIERVLTGYDVNLTATHLAATTLGLLSPTTAFREMKINRALLGVEGGAAYLGSLEFLSKENQPRLLGWPTGVEQIESEREATKAEPADLVIMNPPFTRDSLRHDQFSRDDELLMKEREKELFATQEGGAIHRSHNGGAFMQLSEHIAKHETGAIAVVLPLVGATNYSTRLMRIFLAKKFHIETIVTSHDPTRIYFSENTSIGEMLLICRRWSSRKEKPATQVVNLYENPATPATAIGVARDIVKGNDSNIKGTAQMWPQERISEGNWGGVQFLSPYLCEQFYDLRHEQLFATRELGELAAIGPAGRRTQDAFVRSDVPNKDAMIALWYHKTNVTQKMLANWDTYIVPIESKSHLAEKYWAQRGYLMLPFRLFLPTIRCMSVRLNQKVLGSLWLPCRPSPNKFGEEIIEKALCVYFNSAIGILALLGDRTNKKPTYPQMSIDDLRRIPVPDFDALDESRVSAMAAAYDALCNFTLLPLPQILQDETRGALDRIVSDALGIAPEITATIRRELSREPSITGKPYQQ
ncbi:MAG: hypothetical protein OXE46_12130 [Chloroflexi bacterium]|nr:hypothetical protein [Chloroflexota bacterium]